jgi:lysophospholipase L1-like esterase
MPAFPELVAAQLQQHYKSDVTLLNRAGGGWVAPHGAGDLDALLVTKPDLVIIAYGMNDVSYRNADAFKQTITGMIQRIHEANTETDVILVAPMTGHAQWVHTPPEMFPQYRDALASLTGPGVALADVTSVWQEVLRHKREVDLTGNGVNHPNDFGHRLYAQVILALLVEPKE